MSSSYINVSLHIIFHIKNTSCVMKEEDLTRIFHYIGGTIRAISGHVYIVGGRPDHIHILASPPVVVSLADFVRTIKANTSRWIKGLDSSYSNFSWQEGYAAFSVSASRKVNVIHYISNQEIHHRKQTTLEEFHQFLEKNGFRLDKQN
ncbi:MAG: transposase [Akkermansia sp.]|nr:transposase [Akkermansia sp.]